MEEHRVHTHSSHSHHHHHSRRKRREMRKKRILIISGIVVALLLVCLIVGVELLQSAKQMKGEAADLKTQLQNSMQYVKAQDYDNAEKSIHQVDVITGHLSNELDKPIWKLAMHFPVVGKDVKSVDQLIGVVDLASDKIMKPLLAQVKENPLSELKVGDGFNVGLLNSYVDFAEKLQPDIEYLATKIDGIKITIDKDGKLNKYKDMLVSMSASYKDMKAYLPVFRTILGDGSDRNYMLAAQNSSEIRSSGGFPGSIGTVQIQDGIMTIGDFSTPYKVLTNYMPQSANITENEHELFGGAYASAPRDADFNPDFGRVASIWKLSYEAKTSEHLDGVISLTPSIIQNILKITGEITLSDGTVLNGDNATKVLEHDLYYKYLNSNNPNDLKYANDAADALFEETAKKTMSLFSSKFNLNAATDYLKIFDDGMKDRTVMVWMDDESEQQVMIDNGCSGVLNTGANNAVAGVYFSSNDSSKMGWFFDMDTKIGAAVKNSDGTTTYEVTTTLGNAIDADIIKTSSIYILGECDGDIRGDVYLFAPTGGTISDFSSTDGQTIAEGEYEDLQLGYALVRIKPNTPIEITYKVTTAAGVSAPLTISSTPTLQNYR